MMEIKTTRHCPICDSEDLRFSKPLSMFVCGNNDHEKGKIIPAEKLIIKEWVCIDAVEKIREMLKPEHVPDIYVDHSRKGIKKYWIRSDYIEQVFDELSQSNPKTCQSHSSDSIGNDKLSNLGDNNKCSSSATLPRRDTFCNSCKQMTKTHETNVQFVCSHCGNIKGLKRDTLIHHIKNSDCDLDCGYSELPCQWERDWSLVSCPDCLKFKKVK